ncbi:Ppx/GppA phosphatase family protein [Cellulosimicrobium marinum]|uniref:Ppx/GppA phosphatase family protein n=1 Tax=Cellulosimicrobium marinum TaxID=1638992 RepID=UPI001E55E36F|nr:Ppx/GppA family phosphatase [Cellulosimicrobium marinum]MCB7135671.1 Ppx/GppA family phosphatase [Cellulosimicrobium marinum]
MTTTPAPPTPTTGPRASRRLGVLDIGSNTVHLAVVDAAPGARPVQAAGARTVVRIMRYLQPDGSLSAEGVAAMLAAVDDATALARESAVEEMLPMATSALRDATNGPEVLAAIGERVGQPVRVLSGEDESRLTFLAARRWHGWAAGRLLVLDIGGGSLEIASGVDEEPDLAASVPLGAGRMTMAYLASDPPRPAEVDALREHVRAVLAPTVEAFERLPRPDHVVATSKTFRSLARLAGMQVEVVGPDERWRMRRSQLADWVPRLARLTAEGRTALPGVTPERTFQIVAGGVVAVETMKALGVDELEICPWALREGAILRRLDHI